MTLQTEVGDLDTESLGIGLVRSEFRLSQTLSHVSGFVGPEDCGKRRVEG